MSPSVNTGSIVAIVFSGISPFPTAVSGILIDIVDHQRFFVEQFTGDTIGSVIGEQYQSPITDLSTAQVLNMMAVQDIGVKTVGVGNLRTDNANLTSVANTLHEKAIFELRSLIKGIKSYKARGE